MRTVIRIAVCLLLFGAMTFFTGNQTSVFAQSAPAPQATIAPGDVLSILVFGSKDYSDSAVVVLNDGSISSPGIDHLVLGGKTILEAKALVTRALAKILKDPQVTVTESKPYIQLVYVVGETPGKGPIPYHPGMRLSELLGSANLLLPGNQLDGVLNRADGTVVKIDVAKVLDGTGTDGAILIEPSDVLSLTAKAKVRIWVQGYVLRPGEIRVEDGIDVYTAVAAAGGLDIGGIQRDNNGFNLSDATIQIHRGNDLITVPSQRSQNKSGSDPKIETNDLVTVVLPKLIHITVAGLVNRAGEYSIREHDGIQNALASAFGVQQDGTTSRVIVFRKRDVYQINASVSPDGKTQPFELEGGDLLYVPENRNYVYAVGSISRIGRYAIKDGEQLTATDLMALAGGPSDKGTLRRVTLIRADKSGKFTKTVFNLDEFVRDGKVSANPVLHAGDVLYFGRPLGPSLADISQIVSTAYLLKVGLGH